MNAEIRDSLAQVQELLGCPWCGEAPQVSERCYQGSYPIWTIQCVTSECPARRVMVEDNTKSEAITAWNNRHGAGDAEDSARLDWLCTGNRKRVEDTITTGWFRVYHDVAPMSADHAEWRAMTEEFYPTTREAIDAARAGERG